MNEKSKFEPTINVSWQIYNGKAYILNEIDEELYILEDVALEIWKAIQKDKTIEKTIEDMWKKYLPTDKNVKRDIFNFLKEMENVGLIKEKISCEK